MILLTNHHRPGEVVVRSLQFTQTHTTLCKCTKCPVRWWSHPVFGWELPTSGDLWWAFCIVLSLKSVASLHQLIGLREKKRNIPYFMGKSMISCRCSLKSTHWNVVFLSQSVYAYIYYDVYRCPMADHLATCSTAVGLCAISAWRTWRQDVNFRSESSKPLHMIVIRIYSLITMPHSALNHHLQHHQHTHHDKTNYVNRKTFMNHKHY